MSPRGGEAIGSAYFCVPLRSLRLGVRLIRWKAGGSRKDAKAQRIVKRNHVITRPSDAVRNGGGP